MNISANCKNLRKNVCYDFYGGLYSPSHGIIANVVLGDLDLNFQRQTVQFAILTSIGRKIANATIAIR